MSTAFDCNCFDCGHAFRIFDGGGFTWNQWLCNCCGKSTALPRYAPRASREHEASIPLFFRKYTKTVAHQASPEATQRSLSTKEIQLYLDRPQQWLRYGDEWCATELNEMLGLIGDCDCGGEWVNSALMRHLSVDEPLAPHPLRRCPNCNSKNYSFEADFDIVSD